jgi:GNAT superfamily N-acetyltransferase
MSSYTSAITTNNVTVRPYRGDIDFPGVVAFVAMQSEHERERLEQQERKHGGRVAPKYTEELLRIVAAYRGCLLIAETNSTPIGFIAAYVGEDADPMLEDNAREHAYVRDLFVLPNWRRMGVGRKLVMVAERHFTGQGVSRIRLAGSALNEQMQNLCKGMDFRPYAIVYDRIIPQQGLLPVAGKV